MSASTESEHQEVSGATSETSQAQRPVPEETPVPASRPLSLSPTSIDVLGTALSVAAASLVSGSSDPLLTSGLALPGMQGMQRTPSPMSDPGHIHSHGVNPSQDKVRVARLALHSPQDLLPGIACPTREKAFVIVLAFAHHLPRPPLVRRHHHLSCHPLQSPNKPPPPAIQHPPSTHARSFSLTWSGPSRWVWDSMVAPDLDLVRLKHLPQ
ncbi:hypothetical protein EI94DRAFT_1009162 [Lactarius quietus]|nr:hypothetical protein EI94DRAFT_1009162 [Lactarius quietus]